MIVSNTTPITNLLRLGLLPVLGHLVGELVVPPEVLAELEAGHGPADVWLPSKDVLAVEVKAATPSALFVELRLRLDAGEAAAICLALDVGASCVLMDEVEGRHAARRHGLKVVGTLALLVEMRARGLLDDLEAQLERLRHELHFWVSDGVHVCRVLDFVASGVCGCSAGLRPRVPRRAPRASAVRTRKPA